MTPRKKERDTDARNRGVEERAEDLREPAGHPPREGVHGEGGPEKASGAEREPAAPEQLENPPQVRGPRERLNDESGEKGVD